MRFYLVTVISLTEKEALHVREWNFYTHEDSGAAMLSLRLSAPHEIIDNFGAIDRITNMDKQCISVRLTYPVPTKNEDILKNAKVTHIQQVGDTLEIHYVKEASFDDALKEAKEIHNIHDKQVYEDTVKKLVDLLAPGFSQFEQQLFAEQLKQNAPVYEKWKGKHV